MNSPLLVLFSGVNGAGKSTLYRSGIWEHNEITSTLPRVNPDEILAAHRWNWMDSKAQMRAAREALEAIRNNLSTRSSFSQETTLSGKGIVHSIRKAHELGYYIVMFYVGLDSPDLASQRIAHRVSTGGHDIDKRTVKRRYDASLKNFGRVIDLCNEAYLYDNTTLLEMVARFELGEMTYLNALRPDTAWHYRAIREAGYEEITL